MFDKLIESNSAEAEFKPRSKFFMMSSVVVGILFLSALVFSLYAADIDLGTDNFELVQILAPTDTNVPEPEPARQQPQQATKPQTSERPSRQALVAPIDQTQQTPTTIATTPNTHMSIPDGAFVLDVSKPESNGTGTPTGAAGNRNGGSSSGAEAAVFEVGKLPEPPPIVKSEPKPPPIKSEGVINGKATYLPTPPYPTPAKMVGAYGVVNVQVTIDEGGKVISSKAISGHPLLRATAETAAWKAKFSPTYLSRVPVKVTGFIIFNFKQS
ncbi:MAG: TonB family protein [Acidobacteriota bacterium]